MPTPNTPSEDTPPRRGRGAPPGNLNAVKHGFYSKIFRLTELEQLPELPQADLAREIDLLRLIIKRTVDRCGEAESFDTQLRFLSVLSQATAQLTRLLNIQQSYLTALRKKENSKSFDELYRSLRRDPFGRSPSSVPSPAPSAGAQAVDRESAASQTSFFDDQEDQLQEGEDDKFWPLFPSS
jgi:hypothetical protein